MSLDHKDLELIERLIYKCADDVAVSVDRSIDRLSERFNDIESRVYSRIGDVEEKVEDTRQSLLDALESLQGEIRDFRRSEM